VVGTTPASDQASESLAAAADKAGDDAPGDPAPVVDRSSDSAR
jgi:hypothetical protein